MGIYEKYKKKKEELKKKSLDAVKILAAAEGVSPEIIDALHETMPKGTEILIGAKAVKKKTKELDKKKDPPKKQSLTEKYRNKSK